MAEWEEREGLEEGREGRCGRKMAISIFDAVLDDLGHGHSSRSNWDYIILYIKQGPNLHQEY